MPKLRPQTHVDMIETLKEKSTGEDVGVFRDREQDDATPHVVCRSYHPRYWCNLYLENIYPSGEKPRDFEPMYYESELERRIVFCVMQSSFFYLYWMTYGNERDLNWGRVPAFPMPDDDDMEEHRDRAEELSESLWKGMERMFEEEGVIHAVEFKPIVNKIDELVGDLYGLDDETVEYLQNYHAEYGRGLNDGDSASLDDFFEEHEYEGLATDD